VSDLFEIPESLSPRLRWLARHDLTVYRGIDGKYVCMLDFYNHAKGETEEEACVAFCVKTQLEHWSV
jgi:hypothetical protein